MLCHVRLLVFERERKRKKRAQVTAKVKKKFGKSQIHILGHCTAVESVNMNVSFLFSFRSLTFGPSF